MAETNNPSSSSSSSSSLPPPPPPMESDLRNHLLDIGGDVSTRRRKRTARAHRRPPPKPKPTSNSPHEVLPDLNFPACDDERPREGMRFLLQKQLRNSDVNTLGRIVLPKKEAEAHLPVLTAKEGFSLPMIDMITSQEWIFKYRFWPNNKSRMYILENVGRFIKAHGLRHGDYILVYKDEGKDRYMIRAKKKSAARQAQEQVQPAAPIEDGIFDSIVPDIVVASASYSDLYYPLDDGMNMAFGLSSAFSPDLPMNFPDQNISNSSTLGSIENLFLQDFP